MTPAPYLTAALFCERVIEDKEGVLSVIRIMDSIVIELPADAPDDFPSEHNRLPVAFDGLIAIKTGDSPGEHTLRVEMISPSGKRSETHRHVVALKEQEHGGANLTLHNTIKLKHGGLFHFEVFIDDRLATRVPFRIDVVRKTPTTSPEPPANH